VLLLYWLLRSAGARDFSYGINLSPEQAARIRDANRKLVSNPEETGGENSLLEVLIQAGVRPEKQHIVPYTQLKNLYSLTERSRLSNHEANNISNLTYISHHLNGLEGLSDKALNFRNESEVVLGAHFLDRDDPFHGSITKEKYLRFCKQRRERLARAFHKWLSRLVQGADAALPEQHRIEPVPRLFALTEEDRIRGCDFADMLEDSILSILMEPALRGKLLVNDEKRRRKDQRIIHLWFAPGKVGVQVYPNRDASDTIANIVAEKMATSPAAIYEGVSFAADAVSSQDQLRDVLTVLKETLATNPK
jgi:hypothetical protein